MEEHKGDDINTQIDLSIYKIIDLIKQSYLNINTDFHNSSLSQLIDLEKNEEECFMLMLTMLSNFNKYVTNFEKEITIYLKNYFKRVEGKAFITKLNHDYLKEKCFMFIKCFLEENNIISCLSGYFEEIIESIFSIMKYSNINKQFSEMIIINLIKEPLTHFTGHIHLNELVRLLFILELVFKNHLNCSLEIEKNFDDIFGLYNFLFNKMEENIINNIQSIKNSMNNKDHSYFNILEQSSLLIYHLINSFIKTSLFSLEYCTKEIFYQIRFEISSYDINNNESQVNKVFVENNQFLTFMYKALMISYNISNDIIESNNLYIVNIEDDNHKGYKKYFNIFNIKLCKIKGTLFELMGEIIKQISSFEIRDKLLKFNEFIRKITNFAIDHLVDVYSQNDYPQDYPFENRVKMGNYIASTKIFGFLEKVVCCNIMRDVFEKRKNELVKEIIIKNLRLNEIEKLCFNDQTSDEYVRNIFDLYHLCQENTLKKKNLKILTTLCQYYNCLLEFIINLSINILLYCTLNKNDELQQKEDEIMYKYLITSFSKVELIELSLLLLTSLSFVLSEKPQIHLKIKQVFIQINGILISINDPLLKTKLCMFYAYNLDYLFDLKNEFHLFDQSLQFIFKCTIHNEQNIHLFQIGFNTINSIIFLPHVQPYCYGIISQYLNPLITYIQTSKMQTYEDDYNTFIKGIIQMYLQNNTNNDSVLLFEIFWKFFKEKLSPHLSNNKTSLSKNNNIIRQPLQVKPDYTEIINNCQLLKTFLISFKNKTDLNNDIKQNVFQTIITTLMPIIGNFLNLDFEEDILELLNIVLNSIKHLNENAVQYVKEYLIKMNSGDDGFFNHKFEEYHIVFLFTLVQRFDKEILVHKKIMLLLFDNIECRLSSFNKKEQIHKIIAEHLIYCDFALVFLIHFYSKIQNENEICEALNVFIARLKTTPNNNNELTQKLCICITLVLMRLNSLELLNKIDISIFIRKIIQVYPNKYADRIEHEIIGIGFNIIIRYLEMKEDEMLLKYVKGNFEELVYIKQNSVHKSKKNENEKENEKDELEDDCKYKFTFSKRISHFNNTSYKSNFNSLIMDSFNEDIISRSESNESECDINSEEAIDDEHNKENNIHYSQQYEYIGNENEVNENYYSDDDMEMKDNEIKKEKNECINNKIEKYYAKFADCELINFINSINQFKLFDSFLKDLEKNKPVIYSNIINTIFTESKLQILNKFRLYQKVPIIKEKTCSENNNNNENDYTYRKILKIKKNK